MSAYGFDLPDQPEEGDRTGETTSALDRIRAQRHAMRRHRTRDFDLPGYGGEIVARYHRLPLENFQRVLLQTDGGDTDRNAQFLIDALDGLYLRDGAHLIPACPKDWMTASPGAAPSWAELAQILDLDYGGDARRAVVELFNGNELAVDAHTDTVALWMRSVEDSEDEELASGEA